METGLILRVPEAEPLVGDLRASLDPNAAEGVPAHVTVLYPFRPSEQIDAAVKTCLTKIFRGTPVFDVRFRDVGRFSGVLWLAPEPRAHIDALTRACVAAFPDCLPYAGRFADPAPHLTVAIQKNDARLDEAEATLKNRLSRPLHARISAVCLLEKAAEGWREKARFPLG